MHKNICIKKITFFITSVIALFFVLAFGFNFLTASQVTYQSKAAPNPAASYKEQILKGHFVLSDMKARKDMLVKQFIENPEYTLIHFLLSKQEVDTLKKTNPSIVEMQKMGYIEEYVSNVRGTYMVEIVEDFKTKSSEMARIYVDPVVEKNNTASSFRLVGTVSGVTANSRIVVADAVIFGNTLHAKQQVRLENGASPIKQGAAKDETLEYLVIPTSFAEDNSLFFIPPFTKANIEHQLFGSNNPWSTENFYKKGSWGKVSFKAKVLDWMQISESKTLVVDGDCGYRKWSEAADKQIDAMPAYAGYTKRIYVFPTQKGCVGWVGRAETPGNKIWINGHIKADTFNHEIGHNLGLNHANALSCGALPIDTYDKCFDIEYGNYFDTMGESEYYGHFNALYREMLAWPPAESYGTSLFSISSSGDYVLKNFDLDPLYNDISRIYNISKKNTGERYTIEFRSVDGFAQDTWGGLRVNLGVMINIFRREKNYLINPNPARKDWNHAYLIEGETFEDRINGIKIQVIKIDKTAGGTATLRVTFTSPTPTPS